jgi:lysophospholipase L1-like esterase
MNHNTRVLKLMIGAMLVIAGVASAQVQRVACVGDSITWGGKKVRGKAYPGVLGRMLGDKWEVKNFGQSGRTLLRKGNKPYDTQPAKDYAPNVVIIKLGTNDSKGANWNKKSDFVQDYVSLIQEFKGLKSKPKIWICKPVPAFPGKFGISGKVVEEEIVPMIDEVAKQASVPVIDLFTALSGKKEMFPDTVHPDAAGHKIMADTVYAAITQK